MRWLILGGFIQRLLIAIFIAACGSPVSPARAAAPASSPPAVAAMAKAEPVSLAAARDTAALRRASLAGPFAAAVLRVVDGDTLEARVRIWFGQEIATLVRLRGIDAPEMRARCDAEAQGARAARDALAALIGARPVTLSDVGLDKYGGRVLAVVRVSAPGEAPIDLGQSLLAAGLARPYGGGRREPWCPAPAAPR